MADTSISQQAQSALLSARPTPRLGHPTTLARARQVAQDFEAVYLGEMLKPMFDSVDVSKTFGGGSAEQMWRSMQVAEYGKAIARSGGIGIADAVMHQILKSQEVR